MSGTAATPLCTEHPARAAVAVCVGCRRPICAECSTRFQGIHRCAGCIAALGHPGAAASAAAPASGWSRVLLAWLIVAVLLYGSATLLAP